MHANKTALRSPLFISRVLEQLLQYFVCHATPCAVCDGEFRAHVGCVRAHMNDSIHVHVYVCQLPTVLAYARV